MVHLSDGPAVLVVTRDPGLVRRVESALPSGEPIEVVADALDALAVIETRHVEAAVLDTRIAAGMALVLSQAVLGHEPEGAVAVVGPEECLTALVGLPFRNPRVWLLGLPVPVAALQAVLETRAGVGAAA